MIDASQRQALQAVNTALVQRNIDSQYYYRILTCQNPVSVEQEMQDIMASYRADKLEFIKNPVVAEFLGFSADESFTETQLESSIISNVLCTETDVDIARYSILHGNEQMFASKYKLYLPSEDELRAEIESQKAIFELQQKEKNEEV